MINKIIIVGCNTREIKMMRGYDSTSERGPRGEYSWVLIQPTFLKLLSLCKPSILLLSVPKAIIKLCKRVGVRSHIPNLLGAWG
jgi:hypothetical protein